MKCALLAMILLKVVIPAYVPEKANMKCVLLAMVLLKVVIGNTTDQDPTTTIDIRDENEGPSNNARDPQKNLWNFGHVIMYITGRNPMDYNNYGCYCGWGGAGTPVDGVDRCCQRHDQCYGRAEECSEWDLKFRPYNYICLLGKVTCTDSRGSCEYKACRCDVKMAQCVKDKTYHEEYKDYYGRECLYEEE